MHPKNPRGGQTPWPVSIVGTGSFLPERILTNAELEKMVDTTDEWIVTRTGIRERRIAGPDMPTSEMSARAAMRALEDAKLSPEDIDLIIVGTTTPDMPFPSTACIVQRKIGAKRAACVDMESACTSFMYALETGYQYVAAGTYKNVLVLGAEKLTSITDWHDRATCVLFGDGAGAVVLSARDDKHVIWTTCLGADGSQTEILYMAAGGSLNPATHKTVDSRMHFIRMEGPEVFKQAITSMGRASREVLKRCNLTAADLACVIPHQANLRIIQSLVDRLDVPIEKVYVNIEKTGNISAASVVVALDEVSRSGRLKKGDFVLLVAFGAGLSWGATIIQW